MLASRVGLLVGLVVGGLQAFPAHKPHQGKSTQRALEARLRPATPFLGRLPSGRSLRGTGGATFRPLARVAHTALVSAADWARVVRVHECEEPSSWHVRGGTYAGGLGFTLSTWTTWRAPWMPVSMSAASPQEQAWAMVRFVGAVLHYWPDQSWPAFCSGGY